MCSHTLGSWREPRGWSVWPRAAWLPVEISWLGPGIWCGSTPVHGSERGSEARTCISTDGLRVVVRTTLCKTSSEGASSCWEVGLRQASDGDVGASSLGAGSPASLHHLRSAGLPRTLDTRPQSPVLPRVSLSQQTRGWHSALLPCHFWDFWYSRPLPAIPTFSLPPNLPVFKANWRHLLPK